MLERRPWATARAVANRVAAGRRNIPILVAGIIWAVEQRLARAGTLHPDWWGGRTGDRFGLGG